MLEMNFNPREIESFIRSYYREIRNKEVNVKIENGLAFVSNEWEQERLNTSDINDVISKYFSSQNLIVTYFNISHDKENSTSIKFTRGPVKVLN